MCSSDLTYWTSTGGVNMTGSFSCYVTLSGGAGSVSNFNLSNSSGPGGVSASITGASGTIGSDAHFNINTKTGVWSLNGASLATENPRRAAGSLYGPTATGIGGVWGMSTDSAAAAGVFHGSGPGAAPH